MSQGMVYRGRERRLTASMFLKMGRIIQQVYFPKQRYGMILDAIPVEVLVFKAQLEGKPCHASAIATVLEMPRNTVQRKLEWLMSQGMVEKHGRHYTIPIERLNCEAARRAVGEIVKLVQRTADELSKMEQQKD